MCPACFGENLCPELLSGRVALTGWTRRTLSRLFNAKNVFAAQLRLQGGNSIDFLLAQVLAQELALVLARVSK